MVKKLGGFYNWNSYHRFGKLRQKHFLRNSFNVFLLKVPAFSLITINADHSWMSGNKMNDYYGAPSIQYLDIENRIQGSTSWHYISINTNSLASGGNPALIFDSTAD